MIRHSGSSPARARCRMPGNSLRLARSPVAPNSTITCGSSGAMVLAATSGLLCWITMVEPAEEGTLTRPLSGRSEGDPIGRVFGPDVPPESR